jgi:Cu+-exporting ATPase
VHGSRVASQETRARSPVPNQAKDPICGMMVEVSVAKHKSEFDGNSFYFCCSGCKQKFDNQPEKYALL